MSWHIGEQVAVPQAAHTVLVTYPTNLLPQGHLAVSKSSNVL